MYAHATGRLKILIPELKAAAIMLLVTRSIYNIIRFSEQLAAVEMLAKNYGCTMPMIPLVLTRRLEEISANIDGRKKKVKKYLCNIEIDSNWMGSQLMALANAVANLPALPEGSYTPEEEELEEHIDDTEPPDEEEFFPGFPGLAAEVRQEPLGSTLIDPQLPLDSTLIAPKEHPYKAINGRAIQAVLAAKLSENAAAAVQALNKSNLPADMTPNQAVEWMRIYRTYRGQGMSSDVAAQEANNTSDANADH